MIGALFFEAIAAALTAVITYWIHRKLEERRAQL